MASAFAVRLLDRGRCWLLLSLPLTVTSATKSNPVLAALEEGATILNPQLTFSCNPSNSEE
jgi:hypothetical protein